MSWTPQTVIQSIGPRLLVLVAECRADHIRRCVRLGGGREHRNLSADLIRPTLRPLAYLFAIAGAREQALAETAAVLRRPMIMSLSMTSRVFIACGAIALASGCGKNETTPPAVATPPMAQVETKTAVPVAPAPKAESAPTPAPQPPPPPTPPPVAAAPQPPPPPPAPAPAVPPVATTPATPADVATALVRGALASDEVTAGLKEALSKGVEKAVESLGKEDGFLKNLNVKIPMPDSLKKVEKTLRTLRQDKMADEFVTTINRAAEKAVPEAAAVLGESIKKMSIADAKAILNGPKDAATQYFRKASETNLYARFLPIVKNATSATGVTSAYKQMTDKASFASPFLGADGLDIDAYVTRKALDGLFVQIADQEKRIRENPVARTTDLLQKVFGGFGK